MERVEDIVIIGAGIAGLSTALGLYRLGLRSIVLESSDKLRASGFSLTIKQNAWNALDALGVGDSLREKHTRVERLFFTSASSGCVTAELPFKFQRNGKWREREVRSGMRNQLVMTLAEELPEGTIRLSSTLVSIEEMGKLKVLHLANGSKIKTKVLIGCDGVNSIIAKWLQLKPLKHGGRYASRGFAMFPEGHGYRQEYSQHNGKGYRAGFIPCTEKNVYWWFSWTPDANDTEIGKDAESIKEFVLRKITSGKVPDEFLEIIGKSEPSSVAFSPMKYRSPFDLLWGSISKGNVCVAGDAFHPMTPDIGQGGCLALEEGVVLARCLSEAFAVGQDKDGDRIQQYERIEAALKKYGKERRWRCFELALTSYLVGYILESKSVVMGFIRDYCIPGLIAKLWWMGSDFDCGGLKIKQY